MIKKLWNVYKIQLLASTAVAIIIIALMVIKTPLTISLVILAAFFGTFILDLDYIVYAYFLEPTKPFSKTLRGYINSKDILNAINYIFYNKSDVKEKTLNSVLFQIVLAIINLIVITSTNNIMFKVFVLSILINSIYKMADYYFDGRADEWFWELKNTPSKKGVVLYTVVLVLSIIYGLSFI